MSDLTPKQARFAEEYLIDLNATQAAKRAGYSTHTADVQGPRLLGNVGVAAAIQAAQTALSERLEVTAERVVAGLLSEAEGKDDSTATRLWPYHQNRRKRLLRYEHPVGRTRPVSIGHDGKAHRA